MKNPYSKWRDSHVLFIDDGFDCDESYSLLSDAGFDVRRFSDHFKSVRGSREQAVLDPAVIKLCNRHAWLLITLDSAMVRTHRSDIERSDNLAILASAHNTCGTPEAWAESLIKLKPTLEQNGFKKRPRPWFGTFDLKGQFATRVRTIETLEPQCKFALNVAREPICALHPNEVLQAIRDPLRGDRRAIWKCPISGKTLVMSE